MSIILPLSTNSFNLKNRVSPIENGYIPVNARTLDTKNKDFYINTQDKTTAPKENNNNDYLETLKKQIDFSKEELRNNIQDRKKELIEETLPPISDKIRKDALQTYDIISLL